MSLSPDDFLRIEYMRRNRVTAPTDLMSELDSDDESPKLGCPSQYTRPYAGRRRCLLRGTWPPWSPAAAVNL